MKQLFSVILISFILFSSNSFSQWEILNEGFNGSINAIDFVNEDVGWIAGDNGMLEKTTDGGENWDIILINEDLNFGKIDFLNESVGYAIGKLGDLLCIWKSTNGGNYWIEQFSSAEFGFSSLNVVDANNVYLVGSDTIFKTTNAGEYWIDVSPNLPDRNYNSLWFQNSETGVVVGSYSDSISERGVILKTTNGGTDWNETIVNEFNSMYDLQFLDSANGYFRAHLDTMHLLCKTENMFMTWNIIKEIPAPNNFVNPLRSYQFLDTNIVYAIMDDSVTSNNIMKSTNGGVNWQNVYSFSNINWVRFNKIFFNRFNCAYIIASCTFEPIFLKSIDEGISWSIIKFNYPLKDVSFFNDNEGVFLGGRCWGRVHDVICAGHIFITTDGGKSWSIEYSTDAILKSVYILNENVAYSIDDQGIYKTYDKGSNWNCVWKNNPDSNGYEFQVSDISFENEAMGWAVGRYCQEGCGAGILSTTDLGENWNMVWQFPDTNNYQYNLMSIQFTSTNGWSVGESGIIVKYTPQTGWIKQSSETDLPLNKVFFSDEDHGWIAGGYRYDYNNEFHRKLLRTTNGGVSWDSVPNFPYLIRDIAFIDNNIGWAIGYSKTWVGGILRTANGGDSWIVDTGNLPEHLNSLFIKDNYAWAVGDNGLILRNTDAGTVWVEDENSNTNPTEYVLKQNYPNPFNPSTLISYRLPVAGKVVLKVYDILGREISTIIDEYEPAGVYNVDFNCMNLSSGVYLYRLKVANLANGEAGYSETKKMVVIR